MLALCAGVPVDRALRFCDNHAIEVQDCQLWRSTASDIICFRPKSMRKTCFAFASYLALFPCWVLAQSACRQATASVVEHREAFTILSISLPSQSGHVTAKAAIPNDHHPAGAFVFSLSRLVGSEPDRVVEMMPVAIGLATKGRPTVLIQRTLTWPTVDNSVGRRQADVLCAEQWLSAHAAVKADDWQFVGPEADVPTFEQLHALGDNSSMTFRWGFPLAGINENENTDGVLRDGFIRVAALINIHQ
jgi:hypothetical protein